MEVVFAILLIGFLGWLLKIQYNFKDLGKKPNGSTKADHGIDAGDGGGM